MESQNCSIKNDDLDRISLRKAKRRIRTFIGQVGEIFSRT